jgi:thiol-disulfide isomerase/thioredoxin
MSQTAPAAVSRRALMYASVAAAATLAGAGVAWRNWTADSSARDAAAVLWPLSFDTPSGAKLEMGSLRGKLLLLNFWATWCPPCVDEMPMLDAFFRENSSKSWQVIGLAIDQPSAVRAFLARTPVSYPVGLAGLGGSELSKQLGNLAGGLPFTVVIGATGYVLQRKIGRISAAELAQWRALR